MRLRTALLTDRAGHEVRGGGAIAGTRVATVVASIVASIVASALAFSACAGGAPSVRAGGGGTADGAATDFRDVAVRDAAGQETTLRAALAGRPALVSLWAPWCAPCLREQPALERLARAAEACGGRVVAVGVGETPETVADFARSRGITFQQLADERFTLADALGRRRIPATVVLDRSARIVFTGEALDPAATAALAGVIGPGTDAPPCALP